MRIRKREREKEPLEILTCFRDGKTQGLDRQLHEHPTRQCRGVHQEQLLRVARPSPDSMQQCALDPGGNRAGRREWGCKDGRMKAWGRKKKAKLRPLSRKISGKNRGNIELACRAKGILLHPQ